MKAPDSPKRQFSERPKGSKEFRDQDPRRPMQKPPKADKDTVDLKALKAPLPRIPEKIATKEASISRSCHSIGGVTSNREQKVAPGKGVFRIFKPVFRWGAECVSGICGAASASKSSDAQPVEAPPRLYRVHPGTDGRYFVRPDAGLRGRIPGMDANGSEGMAEAKKAYFSKQESQLQTVKATKAFHRTRTRSLPPEIERRLGFNEGFNSFASISCFDNLCTICFEAQSSAILLPCRHGDMCEPCLRRAIMSRPAHKGGRACPFCRMPIREVVKMYSEGYSHMYGYAIQVDIFCR
eukprot:gnl/MRDRNA2_/MRDRNA2_177752_c0_seq1.p1 gnl/MRDRNA2_/MRDRNA2_177752_c0~~gnl/MRDRNA2_/MRDRNA2_177752_c0_seq1.p1  ORF type:complete len:295 (+),score=33.44 gnl/MRDRNA2_/MRDRNA2_177752_c0_seq1:79-963(+)